MFFLLAFFNHRSTYDILWNWEVSFLPSLAMETGKCDE